MHTRQNALHLWLTKTFDSSSLELKALTGDASFRHYYRITHNQQRYIIMDAPPQQEKLVEFMHVHRLLVEKNLPGPSIHAQDLEQGFLALDDLGDEWLLSVLSRETANDFYLKAMQILLQMQQCQSHTLPIFDAAHIHAELTLFTEWFIRGHLNIVLSPQEQTTIQTAFEALIQKICQQTYVFMHRDYHSRNLMVVSHNPLDLGLIDFQDAMHGPMTYDLVSLLKDCYIQWPKDRVKAWVSYFYQQLRHEDQRSEQQFFADFELCGLQRHLKVLGVFARLSLRDHKPGYLKDLPLTMQYVMSYLEGSADFSAFYQLMQNKIYPSFLTKAYS